MGPRKRLKIPAGYWSAKDLKCRPWSAVDSKYRSIAKGTLYLPQHSTTWHKHGLVGQPLTASHRKGVEVFLQKQLSTPHFEWYARDLFWAEVERHDCEDIQDLHEFATMESLAAVNDLLKKHKSMRIKRCLKPFQGPQSFADIQTDRVDYCGEDPKIFQYFHPTIFWDEVHKMSGAHAGQPIAERTFMQALQATTNRMANWSHVRTYTWGAR